MFCRFLSLANAGASRIVPRALRVRHFASELDPRFIILNPRQAGIVRRPRRRVIDRHEHSNELQPPPLEPQLPQQASVVTEIHSRRPESKAITTQRYNQLRDELQRGFKKSQLAEYLSSQGISLPKSATKQKMVNHILSKAWNCVVRKHGEGALIENSLELSERDFVLLLGGQGRLLREWSKSGARISLLPRRCQIQVQSRQQTFDWINASLSKFLETVIATEVDISEFKRLMNPLSDPALVAAIQQLTDTYFGNKNLDADSITVFSAGHNKYTNAALVKRLLLHLADPIVAQKWRPSSWLYDTNSANHASYFLHPFEDSDSLEWTARLRDWTRWEAVKRRASSAALETPDIKELQSPAFDASVSGPEASGPEASVPHEQAAGPVSLEDQVKQITHDLCSTYPAPEAPGDNVMSSTLTFTPGYILHDAGQEVILPNAAMPKVFNSNIPYVSTLASTLPMYAKDIHHDDEQSAMVSHDSEPKDLWMDILNMNPADTMRPQETDANKRVFTSRRKDLPLAPNLRLIQIKFVANPSEGHALDYPPVVAWATLPSISTSGNSRLTEIPRLDAVPMEASAHVSLPNQKSDLKITLAHTYPIKITEEIETYFMKKCYFGRLGPYRIPPELKLEIGGKQITYLYHSSVYITLAELELNKRLFHLSQVEGGKLGGRKVEASLVLHAESAAEFSPPEAAATAQCALDFVNKL